MSVLNVLSPSPDFRIRRRKNHLRLLSDLVAISIIYVLSSLFCQRMLNQVTVLVIIGLLLTWYFSSKFVKLYDSFRFSLFIDELLILVPNLIVQLIVLTISLFLLNDHQNARSFTVVYALSLTAFVAVKMYFTRRLLLYWHIKGDYQKKIVVVGDFTSVYEFIDLVQKNPQYGYKVSGARVHDFVKNDKILLKETLSFLQSTSINEVDELVIAIQKFSEIYVAGLIEWADKQGVLVKFTPGFFQLNASRYSFELLAGGETCF